MSDVMNGDGFDHISNGSQSNESASPEDKFNAAVRVIQSLPKNGSFQPSHAMMLRFYSLYKQAKFGVCRESRPAFWDVVGRAKWDAWKQLGSLSRTEAMLCYVDELKNVIETMPHTPDVSLFLEKLGSFYELVDEVPLDSESAVAPTTFHNEVTRKDSTSCEKSSLDSSTSHSELRSSLRLAQHIQQQRGNINSVSLSENEKQQQKRKLQSSSSSSIEGTSRITSLSSESDDEFVDSVDKIEAAKTLEDDTVACSMRACDVALIANQTCQEKEESTAKSRVVALCPELAEALARINSDLNSISQRLDRMECCSCKANLAAADVTVPSGFSLLSNFCQFKNVSPRTVLLLIAWPLLINLVIKLLRRRNRH